MTIRYRFADFTLDPGERRLIDGDRPVELNARYLDALELMVREAGKLVSKDRFLDEVWRGVPVTDEALTQCIKSLRRQLGDDAARPRFIETVPKHGYRFIAPVKPLEEPGGAMVRGTEPASIAPGRSGLRKFVVLGAAGVGGGGFAGLLGGLFYGFGGSQPLGAGMGAASVLLVLVSLTVVAGLFGGAGVGFGLSAAALAPRQRWYWPVLGGAIGGLVVGAVVKLVGIDAFNLLVGRAPGDITGALEGMVLGGAVGLGAWVGGVGSLRQGVASAGLAGGIAGALIPVLGGRLMGGSLDQLAQRFPDSHLRTDQVGRLFGEQGFGPISQSVTGLLEGLLFGGCVVGAMILARRSLDPAN